MDNLPNFVTERTRLRPIEDHDFINMRELDSDPEVVRYLGHGRIRREEETRANLLKIFNDYKQYGLGLYIVEDLTTREFLGRAGLIPWIINNELTWEIGYSFKRPVWGRGYATEVAKFLATVGFAQLKQDCLISLIHPENSASIHVATKVGMKFWKNHKIGEIDLSMYRCIT
jgi:RimJ/RimL family protein N-acetyltransferase